MPDVIGEATAFRSQLLDAGLLLDLGVPGLYARSSEFEGIVDALDRLVTTMSADEVQKSLRFPPVFQKSDFERTDYVRSFPDLTGAVSVFVGDDQAHRRLLAAADQGGDWTTELVPSDVVLTSSACHPLYGSLTGRLSSPVRVDLLGWCFRHEPSLDPGRMQVFRQHEVVYVGEAEAAVEHRDRWVRRALELGRALGLDVHEEVANDPFFGRAGRILARGQKAAALKIEIVAPVGTAAATTAVASSNCHQDHFGAAFDIRMPDESVAHSACVGFGLERLTVALLRQHGLEPDRWPASVRGVLGT